MEDVKWPKTATRVKSLREERKWSQKDLAGFLGLKSDSSITHIEKGRHLPKGRELVIMSKLFDVSTDYLLGLDDKKKH